MKRYCSFCLKSLQEVDVLVGGTGVYICDSCIKWAGGVAKNINKQANGLPAYEEQTTEVLLSHLPRAAVVAQQAQKTLEITIKALRTKKVAWQKIADALGISRQAAWEKFKD